MTATPDRLAAALADRYRVERELGAGGMATVYLASDVRHQRKVALKVLHPELSAVLGPERFLKEIELTANLQHPHILPLFDSRKRRRAAVLRDAVRRRRDRCGRDSSASGSSRSLMHCASPPKSPTRSQYAHERGVIHRDIKPENILLQGGACARRRLRHRAGRPAGRWPADDTDRVCRLGTPQYMAPEQAMGEKTIDARADIYALGAVTYEMLDGRAAVHGSKRAGDCGPRSHDAARTDHPDTPHGFRTRRARRAHRARKAPRRSIRDRSRLCGRSGHACRR